MLNLEKLKALIKDKGWSVSYFCALMGHSRSWIVDMKKGKGIPDENGIIEMANKLDTTVDYLLDKSDQKNKPSNQESLNKEDTIFMDKVKMLSPENRKQIENNIEFLLAGQSEKK